MPRLACFTRMDVPPTGFVGRLLGRAPKEHCFIEIQNLLATKPVRELAAADVETLLSNYRLSRPDATPRLLDFYATAVRHLADDGELPESDRADLKHLRYVLGVEDKDADEAQGRVLSEVYCSHLQRALEDGRLSDAEKRHLEGITGTFALPAATTAEIYKDAVLKVVQQAFDAAVADRRYTEEEEQRLAAMAANLGANISHTHEDRQKLECFRLLARIEAGQLPLLATTIRLQRGEVCHAQFACRLHEKRTVTKRVNYAGPAGSIRIMKRLRLRYGSITVNRVASEELRQIDSGTLYVTNKRLVFNGAAKNLNVPYKKVIGFMMYSDGVQIEKDTGRDQYFIGSGDMELLGAVIDAAITRSQTGAG